MHTWSIIRPRRIQLNQLGPSWSWIELELSHDSISVSCASWAHLQEKLWRHTTSHWFLQIAMYVSTLDKHHKVLQGDTGCHDWLPMPMKHSFPSRSDAFPPTSTSQWISSRIEKKTLILITKPYSSSTWILREKWLEWSGVEWGAT